MTSLPARHYDGRSSAARPVVARLEREAAGAALQLVLEGAEGPRRYAYDDCTVEPAVGDALRRIGLPDAGTVEIADAAAWDAMLDVHGASKSGRALRQLERRWVAVLAALGVTAALLWAAMQYGIPALVDRSLPLIPASLDARVGAGGLDLLDQGVFAPTQLPTGRRAAVRAAFDGVVADLGPPGGARLEFRRGQQVGANAFALPNGIVIVTDELVELAQHDDELRAVFAHEIGHVHHRHAMRALLTGSLSTLLTLTVLGDVSAATSLVASVPTTLAHAAYSRDFEREADAFARAWLEDAHVPHSRLDALLRRLDRQEGSRAWSYLSTHPPLDERLRHAQS